MYVDNTFSPALAEGVGDSSSYSSLFEGGALSFGGSPSFGGILGVDSLGRDDFLGFFLIRRLSRGVSGFQSFSKLTRL